MRASGLALVVLANLGAAFIGAFVGGMAAGLLRSVVLAGVLSLPAMLGVAYIAGMWVTRRKDPPNEREVTLGCCAYVLLCVLLALGARHHVAVLFAMFGGFVVAFCFFRGAQRAWRKDAVAASTRVEPSPPTPPIPGSDAEPGRAGDTIQPVIPIKARRNSVTADRVIKLTLAVAVVTAFGFMLSSFSWTRDFSAVSAEPNYGSAYFGDGGGSVVSRPVPQSSNNNPGQHVVQGYTRSNGTYVAPHVATNPDHDRTNNLSSTGNMNPYTGTRGHR